MSNALSVEIIGGPNNASKEWKSIKKAVEEQALEVFKLAGLTGHHRLHAQKAVAGSSHAKGFNVTTSVFADNLSGVYIKAQPFSNNSCWLYLLRMQNKTKPDTVERSIRMAISKLAESQKAKPVTTTDAEEPEKEAGVEITAKDGQMAMQILSEIDTVAKNGSGFAGSYLREKIAARIGQKSRGEAVEVFVQWLVANGHVLVPRGSDLYRISESTRKSLAKRETVVPAPKQAGASSPSSSVPPEYQWMDESESQRKKSEERVSKTVQNESNVVKILRYVLSSSRWEEESVPTLKRKFALTAIEESKVGVESRNDAGRYLKVLVKRGYLEYFGGDDQDFYIATETGLRFIRNSPVKLPLESGLFRAERETVIAPAAPKPEAVQSPKASAPVAPAAVTQKPYLNGSGDYAAYMQALAAEASETWDIDRDTCIEILERKTRDPEACFESLVKAGHLETLAGSRQVVVIAARWRQAVPEVPETVAKTMVVEAKPAAAVPKQENGVDDMARLTKLAEAFERVRRGNDYQAEINKLDADIAELRTLIRNASERLTDMSAKREKMQSYLTSTEHKEALALAARVQKLIPDL